MKRNLGAGQDVDDRPPDIMLAAILPLMRALPVFDCGALFNALDAHRRDRGLGWYELADELWQQSSDLNAQRTDHPFCGGAVARLETRGATWRKNLTARLAD